MFFNKIITLCVGITLLSARLAVADPLQVVASSADLGAIAKAVGGSHVNVTSLIRGSADLHGVIPKPSMAVRLRKADLVVRIGMNQDTWIDNLIQVARNPLVFPGKVGHIDASETITALDIPSGNIDGSMGDVHRQGNPHYWISPLNIIKIAGQIHDHLVTLDPSHHSDYLKNLNAFKASISTKMPEWQNKMATLENTAIVSYHSTWRYFLNDFGLFTVAKLEPIPGVPPTAKHLEFLQSTLKPVGHATKVIIAPYYSQHVAKKFAGSIAAELVIAPTSVKENESIVDFIDNLVKLFSGE